MIEKLRIFAVSTGRTLWATVQSRLVGEASSPASALGWSLSASLNQPAGEFRRTKNEVFVANIKSQIKRNKTNEIARERNRAVKSEIRTRAKTAVSAVGTENEEPSLRMAVKRIDMAAAKGIIHKNTAANKKSGLMKRIAKLRESANA